MLSGNIVEAGDDEVDVIFDGFLSAPMGYGYAHKFISESERSGQYNTIDSRISSNIRKNSEKRAQRKNELRERQAHLLQNWSIVKGEACFSNHWEPGNFEGTHPRIFSGISRFSASFLHRRVRTEK